VCFTMLHAQVHSCLHGCGSRALLCPLWTPCPSLTLVASECSSRTGTNLCMAWSAQGCTVFCMMVHAQVHSRLQGGG
jgi:hypothetical protein